MFQKGANVLRILLDPLFWKELARMTVQFYYEHVKPLRAMKAGGNLNLHPTVNIRFGENITLGDNVVIEHHCGLWADKNARIMIGDNTGIAFGTLIISSNHGILRKSYKEQEMQGKDVTIESDVWIGANCTVLYGVTIGRNAIIGAGTVITKNIPPFSIVIGKGRDLTIIQRKALQKKESGKPGQEPSAPKPL